MSGWNHRSGWHHSNWPVPTFLKVIIIALAWCTGIVSVIASVVYALMWVHSIWGEDVVVVICFGSVFFAVACFITWMTVEDQW